MLNALGLRADLRSCLPLYCDLKAVPDAWAPTFILELDLQLHQKWHQRSAEMAFQSVQNFTVIKWLCLMNGWNGPAVLFTAPVWPWRQLSLPYWVILSSLSAVVTAPAVIEFGLFSLQTLTPDFIEGDGFWKVGDTGRQTLFLCIRWYTVLEPLMWKMPVRPCSTFLLFLPFLCSLEDTTLWIFASLMLTLHPLAPAQHSLNLENSNWAERWDCLSSLSDIHLRDRRYFWNTDLRCVVYIAIHNIVSIEA